MTAPNATGSGLPKWKYLAESYRSSWFVLAAGLTLTLAAFLCLKSAEERRIQAEFDEIATVMLSRLHGVIEGHTEFVRSVARLYDASTLVEEQEFGIFARDGVQANDEVLACMWAPRIREQDRGAFVAGETARRKVPFRIWDEQNASLPAAGQAGRVCFPIAFVEYKDPFPGEEQVRGFDLASDPERLAAINRAVREERAAITGQISLLASPGNRHGYNMYYPVYDQKMPHDIPEDRQRALRGVVVAVFITEELLKAAIPNTNTDIRDVYFRDLDDAENQAVRLSVRSDDDGGTRFLAAHAEDGGGREFEVVRKMDYGGRRWRLTIIPDDSFLAARERREPLLILLAGLGCSLMLAGYLAGRITALIRDRRNLAALSESERRLRAGEAQLKKALEDEQAARAAAEAAVRARDTFLSVASHELKTPIAILSMAVEQMDKAVAAEADRPADAAQLRGMLATVDRQCARLVRMLDFLLDSSRLAAGEMKLHNEPMDLAELVAEVVGRMAEIMAAAGCACELRCAGPVTGSWDRARLDQVVTNLLNNAVSYGRQQPITVEVAVTGDTARLLVRDRGMGISAEDQGRIFRKFERTENGRARSGMGLGLYISDEIVRAHLGTIRVESRPGEGATFIVTLPGATAIPLSAANAVPVPAPQRTGLPRVLIVEDDRDIRNLLTDVLSGQGYAVVEADNGQKALEVLRQGQPVDLIVLDLMMPVMTGEEFRAVQRHDPALAAIPVIILSAGHALPEKAAAMGVDHWLPKPLPMRRFLDMVKNLIESAATA